MEKDISQRVCFSKHPCLGDVFLLFRVFRVGINEKGSACFCRMKVLFYFYLNFVNIFLMFNVL